MVLVTHSQAADTKTTALAELTAVADTDILYIVDDPGGTPLSKKITVLNLFDTIDTFAELNIIVADKTLANLNDAMTWVALGTFNLGITINTGDPFTLGAVRWDNGSDKIDGEQIADNTIDVDSLDWGAFTDLGESGAVTWGNIAEGELANSTVVSADIKDGEVALVDFAAAAYAKDLVTTAPITGAADNIFVGADSDVTVAITMLKDIVTTAPLTGAEDDVLPGADADLTLAITVLKDLVTTSPVTGGTNDIFTGADADITVALDFTAAWDFGSAAGSEWVNDGNPTTDAAGELALDTTITDHQPLWQYYDGGENMTIIAIDTAQLPALDNEIIKYDAGSDKFVLEADAGGGGGNDVYVEEGDAAKVDSSGADLYIDFDGTNFDVGVVGNEGNITIANDGIDSAHYAAGSIDQEHFAVDVIGADEYADGDLGDTSFSGGASTVESMTVNNATTGTYYLGMFDTDTGSNLAVYTDGALSFAQATGTLASTEFSGGGASLTAVDAATGDNAGSFFDAGTIEHEYGGLQTNLAAYTGLIGITGADTTVEVDLLSELLTAMGDVTAFITDDDMPAVGTDPDVDAAGEIGRDTDGANETGDSSLRGHDGSAQFLYSKKLKTINFTLISPDTIDAADLIPVWHNTSGMTFTIVEWKAWSDDDDVSLEIEELTDQTDYTAITTVDAVEIATNGTGVYYASDATITHAAIEHDHSLAIDFDTSDTPDYVQISITGWFNSDVD